MQDMPPYPSPVAAPDEIVVGGLSTAVFPPAAADDEMPVVLSTAVQRDDVTVQQPLEEEPNTAEDDQQPPRDDGIRSLLITWAYALFNMLMTAYCTSNAERSSFSSYDSMTFELTFSSWQTRSNRK